MRFHCTSWGALASITLSDVEGVGPSSLVVISLGKCSSRGSVEGNEGWKESMYITVVKILAITLWGRRVHPLVGHLTPKLFRFHLWGLALQASWGGQKVMSTYHYKLLVKAIVTKALGYKL